MSAASDDIKRTSNTDRAVACDGKAGFANFKLANDVATRTYSYSHRNKPNNRKAYKCGHCGEWHIGSDTAKVGKRNARTFKERKNHDR